MTTELPAVVDAEWLAARLGEDDLVLADVRGPNAHTRGHIAGLDPADDRHAGSVRRTEAFGLRSRPRRRCGCVGTESPGEERLVLYDGGDCVDAAAALQVAELGGHRRVTVLAGGLAGWAGRWRQASSRWTRPASSSFANPGARARGCGTLDGHRRSSSSTFVAATSSPARAGTPAIRGRATFRVRRTSRSRRCSPRRECRSRRRRRAAPSSATPRPCVDVLPLGLALGLAVIALRSAGYDARNYFGSWHEWSRHAELPMER